MTPAATASCVRFARRWPVLLWLVAGTAWAQNPKDTHHPDPAPTATATAPKPPAPKPPPPKPQTDQEKAVALAKKHAYDQACPLFEKIAHASNGAAAWNDLAQCELHRGRKKAAVEAAQRAVVVGDLAQRRLSYETLQAAGNKEEMPDKGCEWLEESPGTCDEQMWACAYPWEQPAGNAHRLSGHALTFGVTDEERDMLDRALRDNSALREQLAAEWKALQTDRADELLCSTCHARAAESADGLINARAATCFQQRTGRPPPGDICAQSDSDCDTFSACLDEATALAHKSEGAGRAAWPEVSDLLAAAHKVCDATCGVVTRTRCDVLAFDACRGYVGYSCVTRERGKRPQLTVGELSLNDAKGNWQEQIVRPAPAPAAGGTADASGKRSAP